MSDSAIIQAESEGRVYKRECEKKKRGCLKTLELVAETIGLSTDALSVLSLL